MFSLLFRLLKGKSVGELASLRQYRQERDVFYRDYVLVKTKAKKELEEATTIPTAMYRQEVDKAYADYLRAEKEAWQAHTDRQSTWHTV